MKPLVIITTFNRERETRETLAALEETLDLGAVEIVIVDNGSMDDTLSVVQDWVWIHGRWETDSPIGYLLEKNIGCPRALNYALAQRRKLGQPVVKLDNDVRLLTSGWVAKVRRLIENREARDKPVAMVSAYYDGVLDGRVSSVEQEWEGHLLHRLCPIVGHTVWHTGVFMDAVGHFDVLSDEHLYGFEDLIMSCKAQSMGWDMLVWEGWQIENLQRHNSLGDMQNDHVNRMRSLYNQRVAALERGGPIWTGPDGRPPGKDEEAQ